MPAPAIKPPAGVILETKRAGAPVAQVSGTGVIEGYASVFGVVDSGGDMVMGGAFTRSLMKRGAAGVKMLWQHRATEPIGLWTSIVEDGRGLKVAGRLDLSVARAREALSLMRSGAVDGLSIGFRTQRATTDKNSGVRRLREVDLWEISIVTFPMLPQARIEAVKHENARDRRHVIDRLGQELSRLKSQQAALSLANKLQRIENLRSL